MVDVVRPVRDCPSIVRIVIYFIFCTSYEIEVKKLCLEAFHLCGMENSGELESHIDSITSSDYGQGDNLAVNNT